MDITWGVQSQEIAWGWLIAVYLFLAGISGGSFLTAALTDMFGHQKHEKVIRSGAYIAPLSIVLGLGLLVLDLGKPFSFWKLLLYVNFGSVMSIGVFIISIFSALTVVYAGVVWLDAQAKKHASLKGYQDDNSAKTQATQEIAASHETSAGQRPLVRKLVAIIGSLFALGTATYTGFLLSAVTTNNLWHTPLFGSSAIPFLPMLFLVSALSTGLAAALAGAARDHELTIYKKIDIVLIILELLLLVLLYGSVQPIFFSGSMAMLFWVGVVTLGLIIPLVFTIYGVAKHRNWVIPISTLVIVGGFCLRYFVVYSGQLH